MHSFNVCVVALCALVLVSCVQAGDDQTTVLRYDNDNIGVDGYKYAYETSDGVSRSEQGQLKKFGDEEAIVATGNFEYTAPDGQVISIKYIADENGYQPVGDVIPH